jgi:hypothetical protein
MSRVTFREGKESKQKNYLPIPRPFLPGQEGKATTKQIRPRAHASILAVPTSAEFAAGDQVWCSIRTRRGGDMRIQATVVDTTDRRVIVEFHHWHDRDRVVRRRCRPNRVELVT